LSWCGLLGFVLGEGGFKFTRRTIAKGRMQPFTVINVGDEVIDAGASIGDAREGTRIETEFILSLSVEDVRIFCFLLAGD
jgi:hypothetical protein